ncbi:MAG: FAD:protein FMN transferase [bacterium]|nr:FAD:protein FMN transferase [bacterium]
MKVRLLVGAAGIGLMLLLLPKAEPAKVLEQYHVAMGTVVRIALYIDEDAAPPMFALARDEIDRLSAQLTHYGSDSEVARVNAHAADGWMDISPDLAEALGMALGIARRTGGVFDPALGALTHLWGFPDATRPPAAGAIDSALARTGYQRVQFDTARVRFSVDGVHLDLGGAAKGYIVDRTVARLQAASVAAGVVEAGGDLRYWGTKPDGRAWRFGIQHPRQADLIIAVDDVGLAALATSGDYEQTFEFDGHRYHHLLDPSTGMPANRAISATVWARSAMEADALATAAFVAGPQQALTWAAADDSVEVLVYYESGGMLRRVLSEGLKGRLEAAPDSPAHEL